jgi:ABC-2 type transport system ATP-binding protein/lipopolysaccharide transport system ATP-binding protein
MSTRSLKKEFMRMTTGGFIKRDDSQVVTIKALNNINLEIKHGDRIGLIGHNGAGKSTFLKLLAGIYEPINGNANIRGKVTALLDVMLGMDDESTGYENILLRGIIQGMTRSKIHKKQQEIANFTELGDYLNMPIRTYSSGMKVRLAFAIATSISPEILLLDEVIGAGDDAFLKKAKQRMQQLIDSAHILVLASHDTNIIKSICNKVLWLDAGKINYFGDVETGIKQYIG